MLSAAFFNPANDLRLVPYITVTADTVSRLEKASRLVKVFPQVLFIPAWIVSFPAQAESTVHMLNWAIRSVKFLGVEFD